MSTQEQINDEDCQPKAILPSIFSPTTGLDSAVTFAFTRMCYNTWFEGRCWRDVYKLLLDAFRLRLVTQRDLVGKSRRILEEEKSEIVDGLRNFIHLAEAVHELLPQDWNWVHAILCEGLACYHDTAEWYSLEYLPNEDEIAERYQDGLFPAQLQIFAKLVYGTDVGDQDAHLLWSIMLLGEDTIRGKDDEIPKVRTATRVG